MKKADGKKIAIVADWIKDWGGAEKVFADIMELYPDADIFSSVFYQFNNPAFDERRIFVSFLQKLWFSSKINKMIPFLRPYAFESLDLSEYDIVISSSSAESKGIITKPETMHICYCHTPTRYYWSHYHEYFNRLEFGVLNPIARLVMPRFIHSLRMWDYCAAQRVDHFIANSRNTQARIAKYYKRGSHVIYPSIDVSDFLFSAIKDDYYFYVGRCIPYKKFDLLVDAFNMNGKRLILATATNNKLYKELKKKSKPNIEWRFGISNKEVRKLMSTAKALIFPPEEDFGIVPLEAMASGTPVIAYAKGGALETVRYKDPLMFSTGVFFNEQTPESLNKTISEFEKREFDYLRIREYSYNFDITNFKKQFSEFVESKIL